MTAIALHGVSKHYTLYQHPWDRLREVLTGRKRHHERVALQPLSLEIGQGEVVGLIGLNGAGKSTLLKLVAGTLVPSTGRLSVEGRISALLELGGGFHPDMTGRDNVYLSGAVMGLSPATIDGLYPDIVAFAGLADVMEQPVKTYSSGMFVRLAFAVATCVEPDILIIDEALSVGDAAFARKSFDRIMGFKEAGKTILFCSHSIYQVEAICSRVVWLHEGFVRMDDYPAEVIAGYNEFLGTPANNPSKVSHEVGSTEKSAALAVATSLSLPGTARILDIQTRVDDVTGRKLTVWSSISEVAVTVRFVLDPHLPAPRIGVTIAGADGRTIASAGSWRHGLVIQRDSEGVGEASVRFPRIPLLRGHYWLNVYLLGEDGVHLYDQAERIAELKIYQQGLELGIVTLPHEWCQGPTAMSMGTPMDTTKIDHGAAH